MNLSNSGINTLDYEITAITKNGIWIFINEKEYFIPFKNYPELLKLNLKELLDVKFNPPDHLYWENADIDIELNALEEPKNFPLKFKQ